MAKKRYPLARVYGLLEPGPVLLLSTAHGAESDVMPMSWHTMLDFEPPLVGAVVSDRNRSFELLRRSRECVLNIPTADIARQVVGCGNTHGPEVDKFTRFGLTRRPAEQVGAPLVAECYASLECRIADTRMVNRYSLFVLEVVAAWVDAQVKDPRTLHHRGYGSFMLAGETIRLPSRMR
ncbi:MAG TPA: flavin reductase family protein [Ramlibacter sp.]